jgi:hypothetical protein
LQNRRSLFGKNKKGEETAAEEKKENEQKKQQSADKQEEGKSSTSSDDDVELSQEDIKKIKALIKEQDETIESLEKKS